MGFPKIRSLKDIEAFETDDWRAHCDLQSTYELLQSSAAAFGDKPAISFLPKGDGEETPVVTSYVELLARVTQTANLFHELGIGAGDVVSYVLPNLPETHEVIWGGEAAGIINAINPFLEPATIGKLLNAAETKLLVTMTPMPGLDLMTAMFELADQSEHIAAVLAVDPAPYYGAPAAELPATTPGGKPVIHFQNARDKQPSDKLTFEREIKPGDIASLFHTGGTTGTPKLAPHTHENEVHQAWVLPYVIDLEEGDTMMCGLPLFHVNAVMASGLSCFQAGANVLLVTPLGFRTPGVIANTWKMIDRYKVTSMSAVPTIYTALMGVPKDGMDLSSLKFAGCGAAPLSPETFKGFQEYSGVKLMEGYGMTESTCVASFNPMFGESRIGSVGLRLPFSEMRCGIVGNGKVERFCETDEVGTILIRGPHVFPGYYKHDASGLLEDGWVDSGDLGREDAEGYVWLTGRSKDLIIRGGHNIDPSMIENTLTEHDDVAIVAAIGQPDAYAGELPCAYVQLAPGAAADAEEIRGWAKANIPERAAAPVYVEVLETIPVTAVGKVFKPELRVMATQRVLADALNAKGITGDVTVFLDEKKGMVADVRIPAADHEAAGQILGEFTVHYEIAAPN
ncbi:acyl-CoA synthetase [Ruegeria jejuensis]|uniref:acyl-CoA synthetase n=1 Tax=Ruegeria jejuensis TaxID=3233338 RepID=UPI00355BBECB